MKDPNERLNTDEAEQLEFERRIEAHKDAMALKRAGRKSRSSVPPGATVIARDGAKVYRADGHGSLRRVAEGQSSKVNAPSSPNQSLSFSRAVRRRIIVLDQARAAIHAVIESVRQVDGDSPVGAVREHGVSVAQKLASLIARLADTISEGRLLDRKKDRRYGDILVNIQEALHKVWPDNIPAVEYLSCTMSQVAAVEESLPRTPKYLPERYEWGKLHEGMAELYAVYDPELHALEEIERGDVFASLFQKIIAEC